MAKKRQLSMRELEQEAKKFHAPGTDKERAIVEAALELLSERGIDGATTAEIAKRAGVTERTLFRYFPSKRDLVNRVLFPLLLRTGLSRTWDAFEELLKSGGGDFRDWYVALSEDRLHNISRNPGLSRTVLLEVLQDEDFRASIANLWQRQVWRPMVDGLQQLQGRGDIRDGVDVETLARAIHCLHIGYFLARHVFAPERKWDDASEIDKMAEILTRGAAAGERPG